MTDWYIGPWPLDIKQPLRVVPNIRELTPAPHTSEPLQATSSAVETRYTGVIFMDVNQPTPTMLEPPPLSPRSKRKHLDLVKGSQNTPTPTKGKKARVSKGKDETPVKVKIEQVDGDIEMNLDTGGKGNSGKKGRSSLGKGRGHPLPSSVDITT